MLHAGAHRCPDRRSRSPGPAAIPDAGIRRDAAAAARRSTTSGRRTRRSSSPSIARHRCGKSTAARCFTRLEETQRTLRRLMAHLSCGGPHRIRRVPGVRVPRRLDRGLLREHRHRARDETPPAPSSAAGIAPRGRPASSPKARRPGLDGPAQHRERFALTGAADLLAPRLPADGQRAGLQRAAGHGVQPVDHRGGAALGQRDGRRRTSSRWLMSPGSIAACRRWPASGWIPTNRCQLPRGPDPGRARRTAGGEAGGAVAQSLHLPAVHRPAAARFSRRLLGRWSNEHGCSPGSGERLGVRARFGPPVHRSTARCARRCGPPRWPTWTSRSAPRTAARAGVPSVLFFDDGAPLPALILPEPTGREGSLGSRRKWGPAAMSGTPPPGWFFNSGRSGVVPGFEEAG